MYLSFISPKFIIDRFLDSHTQLLLQAEYWGIDVILDDDDQVQELMVFRDHDHIPGPHSKPLPDHVPYRDFVMDLSGQHGLHDKETASNSVGLHAENLLQRDLRKLPEKIPVRTPRTTPIYMSEPDAKILHKTEDHRTMGGSVVGIKQIQDCGSVTVVSEFQNQISLIGSCHAMVSNCQSIIRDREPVQVYSPHDRKNVAELSGIIPIHYFSSRQSSEQQVNAASGIREKIEKMNLGKFDVAWAKANPKYCDSGILEIGEIGGFRKPKTGETIRMFGGYGNELKSSKIESIYFRCRSQKSSGNSLTAYWKDMIRLEDNVGVAGDSGSAYVGEDNMIVGIHRSRITGDEDTKSGRHIQDRRAHSIGTQVPLDEKDFEHAKIRGF